MSTRTKSDLFHLTKWKIGSYLSMTKIYCGLFVTQCKHRQGALFDMEKTIFSACRCRAFIALCIDWHNKRRENKQSVPIFWAGRYAYICQHGWTLTNSYFNMYRIKCEKVQYIFYVFTAYIFFIINKLVLKEECLNDVLNFFKT